MQPMKRTLFFILIFNILLFGCMKSQTKDSLMVQTHEQQFSVATVLAVDFEDKGFAECVQWRLKKEFPKIGVIPGNTFRDALFPWFEPKTAPSEKGELTANLSKTLVQERIEAMGVELLIYVHGDTNQRKFSGFVGGNYGAAAGYFSAKRATHIWTTVWDLKDNVRVGDTDVDFQGTVHIPILGFPILIPVFTESSACNETSKRISNCLKGEGSHKNKFDDR
jgi:hypothetical protein